MMRRRLLSHLWAPANLLPRLWHISHRHLSRLLHDAEALLMPLSKRPLVGYSLGLVSGSLVAHFVPLSPLLIGSLLLATGICFPSWPCARRLQGCCRVFLVGLLLTHMHLMWHARALPLHHIARFLAEQPGRQVTVEGTLDRAAEPYGDRYRLYLQLHRLRWQQQWQRVSGRVRVNINAPEVPFLPGDRIRISRVRLHPTRGFLNPGSFNFQRYMHRRGIYGLGGVSDPHRVSLQYRPTQLLLARLLERWRRSLRRIVQAHLAPPYASVFLAMVLGYRGALPSAIQQSFRTAGVAHLLVVSGLHVGFIAAALLFAWRGLLRTIRSWLPRSWIPAWRPTPLAALVSVPPLVLYCSLVGWKVPTTRAALMVGSSLLALALSRPYELPHALLLAAVLILLLDPTALFTVGFQLSFVAVASILVVGGSVLGSQDRGNLFSRWSRRLWAYLVISVAAYFGTFPILASTFHTLPTFGILANLLLVPLAGVLVPLGVGGLGTILLLPALTPLVFTLLTPLLMLIVAMTETIAGLPAAQMHFASPSGLMLLGYYGLLGSVFLQPLRRWRLPLASGCLVLLLSSTAWQYTATRARQLRVTFLDVGTGDAIFVQIPGNHYLLIDGGGTYGGRFDIGTQVIAPVLWNHFVQRFDLMALTHLHVNHARGLVSLLRLFPTTHLLTNGTRLTTGYGRDLLAAGRRWGTQHHTALDGPRHWQWGRLHLTVLAPPSTAEQQRTPWHPPTENDRSLVLRLQYGAVRLLLTGDIQYATERWLLAHRTDLRANILQVPHHGSKTSLLPTFVRRVHPEVGIISLGAGNPYGHPHVRVLRLLASHQVRVFRTDYHGAITITSDGTQYQVTPFRPYHPSIPVTQYSTR